MLFNDGNMELGFCFLAIISNETHHLTQNHTLLEYSRQSANNILNMKIVMIFYHMNLHRVVVLCYVNVAFGAAYAWWPSCPALCWHCCRSLIICLPLLSSILLFHPDDLSLSLSLLFLPVSLSSRALFSRFIPLFLLRLHITPKCI